LILAKPRGQAALPNLRYPKSAIRRFILPLTKRLAIL
jgi:hypothetical protein